MATPSRGLAILTIGGSGTTTFWLGGNTQKAYALKSLEIGGNVKINGTGTTTLNILVYNDTAAAAASNIAKIHGGVTLTNSTSQLYFYGPNLRSDYQYIQIADEISGEGRLLTSVGGNTTTKLWYGSETVLELNNSGDSVLSGANIGLINRTIVAGVDVKTSYIHIIMNGTGSQTFNNTSSLLGDLTAKKGGLYVGGKARDGFLEGGTLGALSNGDIGTLTLASLTSEKGTIAVDLSSSACDLISVTGAFTVDNAADLTFDFNTVAEGILAGTEYKLVSFSTTNLTAADLENFKYVADGFKADFVPNSKDLGVVFTSVSEPAAFAAVFGAFALALVFLRKRR